MQQRFNHYFRALHDMLSCFRKRRCETEVRLRSDTSLEAAECQSLNKHTCVRVTLFHPITLTLSIFPACSGAWHRWNCMHRAGRLIWPQKGHSTLCRAIRWLTASRYQLLTLTEGLFSRSFWGFTSKDDVEVLRWHHKLFDKTFGFTYQIR